jgi:outer membrane protein
VFKTTRTAVFLLLLLPTVAFGQEQRIAYVDVPFLIDNSPQAQAASRQLEETFGPRQQEMQAKRQEYTRLRQRLEQEGLVMSEEEREQIGRQLQQLERDITRTEQAFREELNLERSTAFEGVREAVMRAVTEIANAEGYDLIIGQGVLYASDAVDLTPRILDSMEDEYEGR